MQKERLFTNHQLVRLLWPLIIEQGLTILVGMADTVMVSSAGEAAISGVSLVDMINMLISTIFAALATGGAVVTSQFIGAKNNTKASESAGQLVLLSALLGTGVAVFCLLMRVPILRLFFGSIEDDVMQAALIYFGITGVSYPFLALYNSGAAIFRSVGNSAISMKVSLLVNVINFLGNALCIYGFHMGVAGVAIPTLISRIVGAVVIIFLATRSNITAHVTFAGICKWQPVMDKRILSIGIPSALENSAFQFGRILVVSMISMFGTVHISANAVANNIDNIGCIVGTAMQLAIITVVGRCIGAGTLDQAISYTKKMLLWDYLIQGATNLAIIIGLPIILKLYTISADTYALSRMLILIHCGVGIILWPVSFILPNALRAANDVRFTMTVSISSMLLWRLGAGYLFCVQMRLGALGVWIAMVIDWSFRSICFVTRFSLGSWKKHCIKI